MAFPSPLRYPGGKGKIVNFIKMVFLSNNLIGAEYVEPYAGGASVGLSLLFEEYVSRIHINDLNYSVFAFWNAVVSMPDELCALIRDAKLDIDEWKKQRSCQAASSPDPLELAFSTFYLNRTTRSGILNGGVIGGKNQDGRWKLDARFNKEDLIRRIQKIARFTNRISVSNLDAVELIARFFTPLTAATFLYVDPPYFCKGKDLYQNFYQPYDHKKVARVLSQVGCDWIVSYDVTPQIADMYCDYSMLEYTLSYSAQQKYLGSEVMFFSHGLRIPEYSNPTKVRATDVNRAKLDFALHSISARHKELSRLR